MIWSTQDNRGMRRCAQWGSVVVLALLTACGPIYSYQSGSEAARQSADAVAAGQNNPVGALAGRIGTLLGRTPPRPTPEQAFTPQALSQITGPVLIVRFEDDDGDFSAQSPWGALQVAGTTGSVATWVEAGGRTLSTANTGVLLKTRGFGRDLMTVRADDLQQVLTGRATGATQALRVHRTLDGSNQIVTNTLVCRITREGPEVVRFANLAFATQRIEEACLLADGSEIINRYWMDAAGILRQSEQWVSPEEGRFLLQRVL